MRRIAIIVAAMCAVSCSDGGSSGDQPLEIEAPATVTGVLDIAVEDGPVGDDGISEVNFGSIDTDDGYLLIEVWADVVRSSGIDRDELVGGGTFTVRIDGPGTSVDPDLPSYRVSELAPSS